MPKLSVIVPCYNVEQYVAKCLSTLCKQTLEDIEIICIDDKSTDNTLQILQEFASKDDRIKLFELSKNSGVAVARNTGLNAVSGEYIGFVDPDDSVDIDFYEKLYAKAIETSADIVRGNVRVISAKNGKIENSWFHNTKIDLYNFASAFWSAIYRADMIKKNKIFFPVGITVAEDSVFLTQATLYANKICAADSVNYYYLFRRNNSLDSEYLSHAKAVSNIKAFRLNLEYILNSNLDINAVKKYLRYHVIEHCLYELAKDYERVEDQRELFNFIVKIRNQYGWQGWFDRIVPKRYLKAFKTNDFDKARYLFGLKHKRIYLFGLLPIIKIEKVDDFMCFKLFDVFPLAVIQNKKFYLFALLLLFKLRG